MSNALAAVAWWRGGGGGALVPARSDRPVSRHPLSFSPPSSLSLSLPPSLLPLTARRPVVASQEDCKYCAQSTRHKTKVKATPMMQKDEVLEAARRAKMAGSTRFCMGTAWRELGAKKTAFKRIVGMVSDIKKLDLEVCCTLGMLSEEQARRRLPLSSK